MANAYKKVMVTKSSTGDHSIYTCPDATTTLIKTAWVYNGSGGSAQLTLKINTTTIAYDGAVADKYTKSWFYLESGDIGVLEANASLKAASFALVAAGANILPNPDVAAPVAAPNSAPLNGSLPCMYAEPPPTPPPINAANNNGCIIRLLFVLLIFCELLPE